MQFPKAVSQLFIVLYTRPAAYVVDERSQNSTKDQKILVYRIFLNEK